MFKGMVVVCVLRASGGTPYVSDSSVAGSSVGKTVAIMTLRSISGARAGPERAVRSLRGLRHLLSLSEAGTDGMIGEREAAATGDVE